jgi:hypothetical protein
MTIREHARLDHRLATLGADIHARKHDVRYRWNKGASALALAPFTPRPCPSPGWRSSCAAS